MTIPEIILYTRKARGLSQQRLGELCGYTGKMAELSIHYWENGKRPIPINRIRPLAKALELPIDMLIP